MAFTAKIQRTIHAPVSKVWAGLTQPELVKQYFFGTNLVTSWQPGSPVYFRGEWEGKPYEDKGTVLQFEPEKMLRYDYFSSWSDLEDRPENYQIITYRVKAKGNSTVLSLVQQNIDTLEKKVHSVQNWGALLDALKKIMEEK
ncbi:MAG TPA: SRPBCC domain-containing protein [Saprospiraceae bacterium]|nr:SRPBCC domain-containing protein [Saprospiraceae bacterium]